MLYTFAQTVVSQEGGIIHCEDDMIRTTQLDVYIPAVSCQIRGQARGSLDKGERIIIEHLVLIAPTAVIAIVRIESTEQPDRLQVIFFQLNPETHKLDWKHLITYDAHGASVMFKKKVVGGMYQLVCFPLPPEEVDDWQLDVTFALHWCKMKPFKATDHPSSIFIMDTTLRVRNINEIQMGSDSRKVFTAEVGGS